ncbi:potassium transporter 7 [Tanacetum coccineum]
MTASDSLGDLRVFSDSQEVDSEIDVHRENHQIFEQLLIESLEKFIRREAKERSLESDREDDTDSEDESPHILLDPSGTPEKDPNNSAQNKSLENELAILHMAKESGIIYLLCHVSIRAQKDSVVHQETGYKLLLCFSKEKLQERDSNFKCSAHTIDGSGHHPHGFSYFHLI